MDTQYQLSNFIFACLCHFGKNFICLNFRSEYLCILFLIKGLPDLVWPLIPEGSTTLSELFIVFIAYKRLLTYWFKPRGMCICYPKESRCNNHSTWCAHKKSIKSISSCIDIHICYIRDYKVCFASSCLLLQSSQPLLYHSEWIVSISLSNSVSSKERRALEIFSFSVIGFV